MLRPDSASAPTPARHLPPELLRRYVAGELPPAEQHAVEAHTLVCDQCADVLEGLEIQPAAVQQASLSELRHRLHARVAELAAETAPAPAALPMWNWRPLAAAAVLLLSLGVVAWLLLRGSPKTPETASRPAYSLPAAPVPDGTGATAAAPQLDMAVVTPAAEPVVPPAALPPRPPRVRGLARPQREVARAIGTQEPPLESAAADRMMGEGQAADLALGEPRELPTQEAAGTVDQARNVAAEAPKAKAKMARAAVASAPVTGAASAEATRTVQGRVTDTAGQPVPGATVLVPGTSTGTSTAADGSFALTVPAATLRLSVSSIGYTSQTRALRSTDSVLALAMVPDAKQLSEVVVRREAPPMLPSIGAMPAGGFPALRQYLRDSLDYPEKALNDHQEGTVRVQFVVDTDGRLRDFKVVSRLSPECDAEALRLLKAGPTWFPAVQNNRRTARKVEINVPFSLEKR
ncbi:TonB family protein [Hymenobacter rubripertinctus]|uniref:TonB family protein n=1 Tax=Hymenobacter rubripertinctus TaxID=2029981 RepID=A0A418R6U5_9BACT|nr:TonB family protein [Hymenobacter rubripertinctus]RIY13011.1 TonB family protein [Hymenobacter rubripertinctus]